MKKKFLFALVATAMTAGSADAKVEGVVYALYDRSADWTLAVFPSLDICLQTVRAFNASPDQNLTHEAVCEPLAIEDANRFLKVGAGSFFLSKANP